MDYRHFATSTLVYINTKRFLVQFLVYVGDALCPDRSATSVQFQFLDRIFIESNLLNMKYLFYEHFFGPWWFTISDPDCVTVLL